MTIIELAIGVYCFTTPWALSNGLNGQYTCYPTSSGTAVMEVVKLTDERARIHLAGAQFEVKICPTWCDVIDHPTGKPEEFK